MATRAPRQNRTRADTPASFQLQLKRQLSHARLSPGAQRALLGAVEVARSAFSTPEGEEDSLITSWLGEPPEDPARLEFEALQARFASRRDLLQHCIGTNDVVLMLGLRNRQTPLDRLKAPQGPNAAGDPRAGSMAIPPLAI